MNPGPISLEALLPEDVARKAEAADITRAGRDVLTLLTLSVLAGAFIALGAMFSTLVSVCLAVWASLVARSVADKVLVILPPVAAFVAAGFEHSVANFYYLSMGWLLRHFAPDDFWARIGATPDQYAMLTLDAFLRTQSVVILGNVAGGGVLVALVYWLAYLRQGRSPEPG